MKSFCLFLIIASSLTSLCQTSYIRDKDYDRSHNNYLDVPPSRIKFRSQFRPSDFVFNLDDSRDLSPGRGGSLRLADIDSMAALSGVGVAAAVLEIEPCGINLPHSHPRASELLYVLEGDFLRVAFTEENGGRTIINDIKRGDV